MKNSPAGSLWKVPAYCMIAGWICFQLEIRFLGRFALVTLPDGAISADNTRWLILTGVLFCLVLALGALVFFRKMTRRELAVSATAAFVINAVIGVSAYISRTGWLSLVYSEISEWCSVLPQLLGLVTDNQWISAVVIWAAPYLFVLFGKKTADQ